MTAARWAPGGAEILAAPTSTLAEVSRAASTRVFVLLDSTLLPTDRDAADQPI